MDELMWIDTGHLVGSEKGDPRKGPHIISTFERFQKELKERETPITLSFLDQKIIAELKSAAHKLRGKYDNILVLGIGGSALGTKAILEFLKGPYHLLEGRGPRIFIVDNIDPAPVVQLERILDFGKTALVYTSKSGSTPETAANFIYFYKKYKEAGGDPGDLVFICDDLDNGINCLARDLRCPKFHFPADLQGRYSVLSPVGFFPAELAGIDCQELLEGAAMVQRVLTTTPPEENPLLVLGGYLYRYTQKNRPIHVLFNYSNLLVEFGLWFMQLWAESLGKNKTLSGQEIRVGATPLASLGATDQHSLLQLFKEGPGDKVYGFVKIEEAANDPEITGAFPEQLEYAYFEGHTMQRQLHIEQLATEMSLVNAGHPCYRITLREPSAQALGALFYLYEALTVFVANLYEINPYDQPGVEEGKHQTYALLGRADYIHRKEEYQKKLAEYHQGSHIFKIN